MPVSSTKMVFLAYFGGNILNGVKLINMLVLGVRIGGFSFGFEGPTLPNRGLGYEISWNYKYKGFAPWGWGN
jgi:hypothetical protein